MFETFVITLFYLNCAGAVDQNKLQNANVESCVFQYFDNRQIFGIEEESRDQIDCTRKCVYDDTCVLTIYQEFQNKSPSCLKLSGSYVNATAVLDVSTSKSCLMNTINRCLNGGQLFQGISVCKDGYTGMFIVI
jgi:hypothetical protein